MQQTTIDTCTRCGNENCKVTIIDDVDRVCDECLDSFFEFCDDCGEYWEFDCVEFFVTKDGRLICEYCRENYEDEDIETEDA